VSTIDWGVRKFGGETYDLSHLKPFAIEVTPAKQPQRRVRVAVSFGFHTFTRKRRTGDPGHLILGTANSARTICADRLECSKHLPDIIRQASAGRVRVSHDGNYLIPTIIPIVMIEHATIFKLEQSVGENSDVRMFVISGHPRPHQPDLREVNFVKLVTRVADGLPPLGK
jgi:hypothetical protein